MKAKAKLLALAVVALAATSVGAPVHATSVPDIADFVVVESPGQYTINNNSSDWYVYGFAVSNPGAVAGATAGTSYKNWDAGFASVDFIDGPVPAFVYASVDADLTDINDPTIDPGDLDLSHYIGPGDSSSDFTFGPADNGSVFGLALVDASGDLTTLVGQTSETPLPATLPLFASGFGILSLLGWRRRRKTGNALVAALALTLLPVASRAGTINFDSIDTSSSPFYVDITSTNYLAQYGVTLVNGSPGTIVEVACANGQYNSSCTSGTGALTASSSPNVLLQNGNNSGESYTLVFSTPLSSLSFYTAGTNGGDSPSGLITAQWSATAYDASNVMLSQVGQALGGSFSNIPPNQWTLSGPGIVSVTFASNCYNVCGENLAIDDLSAPEIPSTPLPSSLLLFGSGLLGWFGLRRKAVLG